MAKLIKNEEEYARALRDLTELVAASPAPGSPDAERLELLGLLIEQYEDTKAPLRAVDPLEAIRFRMDQQGLSQRDLVPYIGSRARVSEVLAGHRQLTLPMIRALHRGLGIPADSLITPNSTEGMSPLAEGGADVLPWEKLPIKAMAARGWLPAAADPLKAVQDFFAPLGGEVFAGALYRKTSHVRTGREMDRFALLAWTARILLRARTDESMPTFHTENLSPDFLRALGRLSREAEGPRLAIETLHRSGVLVIIEPHLPKTSLDGAALLNSSGHPVVGLTLRHDRVDNFWFTLFHELMHVLLHLGQEVAAGVTLVGFYDDLDAESAADPRENEADAAAREALVPGAAWEASAVRYLPSPEAVIMLADTLGVSPAIVAGCVRYERNSYRLLSKLVGHGEVRRLFPEVEWGG
jgi:HTH-type transcriptional regulator / antitoxin HigA